MCDVTDEVDRAILTLELAGKVTRLPFAEAEDINQRVVDRYVGGKDRRWWWEAFPSAESVSFDDGLAFKRISSLVPQSKERCWLIVESQDHGPYPVYDASPEEAVRIIGECFGFEYYIVPKDLSWIICENHHARIIGCGECVEERIRCKWNA